MISLFCEWLYYGIRFKPLQIEQFLIACGEGYIEAVATVLQQGTISKEVHIMLLMCVQ